MTDEPLPSTATRLGRDGVLLALVSIPLVGAIGLSCLGTDPADSAGAAVATVLYTWCTSGAIAVGLVLCAMGLGWPLSRLLAVDRHQRLMLQPAAGLAALLFIDHLVGMAGGFSGASGRVGAWLLMGLGVGLLAVQLGGALRSRPRLPQAPPTALLGVAALAVLLIAACNPPASLWASEARGFDALSYHLPLPQEWAAGDRLWPLRHNVYSFLPSYAEAGFLHVAALCGGELVRNDGVGVLACQHFHAAQTVIAAFTVGALAHSLARRCGASQRGAWLGGGVAFSIVAAAPWSVVTGSLAYNEMAALTLCAGSALAAVGGDAPWRRALGAGLLMGAGAACKPTFLLMAGPTVALLLLSTTAPRGWFKAVLAGVLGGALMLAPPLARNWAACGNPLFPLSTAMGTGHWTAEQAERFHKAHGREGTLGEQTKRLFSPVPEPGAFNGEPRGVMHSQWAMLFPLGGCAALLLMLRARMRVTSGVLMGGAAAGFAVWVVATHGQSRFLIPLLPNLACALGLLAASMVGEGDHVPPARRLSLIFVCVVPLLASAATLRLFLTQNGGRPNELLPRGVSEMSGESLAAAFQGLTLDQRNKIQEMAPPAVYTATTLEPSDTVYMVGDAATLYYIVPHVYSTTWDRSALGAAMAAYPDEPAAWTRAVRDTGATYILINDAEIARYRRTYGFDPAITDERLAAWAFTLGEPVRVWQTPGPRSATVVRLFEVPAERRRTGVRTAEPARPGQ